MLSAGFEPQSQQPLDCGCVPNYVRSRNTKMRPKPELGRSAIEKGVIV